MKDFDEALSINSRHTVIKYIGFLSAKNGLTEKMEFSENFVAQIQYFAWAYAKSKQIYVQF